MRLQSGESGAAGRSGIGRAAAPILCAAIVAAFALSLLWGRYPSPGFLRLEALRDDPMALRVVLLVRLPRIIGAALLGAVLGSSGASMQFVFANPLVDAGFLGVSQGASFGAILALLAGGSRWAIMGSAFVFALLALALSTAMSKRIRFGGAVLRLVLSGIMVASLFSAFVALVKYGADPMGALPEITYWLMGGLSGATWSGVAAAAIPAIVSVVALSALRWRISLLSLDEMTAVSLGAKPGPERAAVLALAAVGVASVTALAGVVSWVGLVVPHMARAAMGREGAGVVPGAAALGAVFAIVCDCLSRGLFPGEIPLGVTTSLAGAAAFFALAAGRRVGSARA